MMVRFQGEVPIERTLRHEAEQQLWSALRQFRQHIANVTVSFSANLESDDRSNKACRIILETHSLGEIAVCVGDTQLEAAIFRAIARLVRAVRRSLGTPIHPGYN